MDQTASAELIDNKDNNHSKDGEQIYLYSTNEDYSKLSLIFSGEQFDVARMEIIHKKGRKINPLTADFLCICIFVMPCIIWLASSYLSEIKVIESLAG